jgi:predicted acetyltransferase
MTGQDEFGLPRDLGDGLLLRWATPDEAEKIARFNLAMHSDNPDEPEMGLYYWVLDLMRGDHPTTKASDFTVVVDTNAEDRIVSSLNLISQTWAYNSIPFGVGRPELVATLPEYRRRGLVRMQMDIIHALSASRGELVTAITGIPWYYRQYGYEMGLNLGGSRQLFWERSGNSERVEDEPYRVRPATAEDIPVLNELYRVHLGNGPITRPRDEAQWRYEMFTIHPDSFWSVKPRLIETGDGRVVGYATWEALRTAFGVREFGVMPGHSWRTVGRFIVRLLRHEAETLNKNRPPEKKLSHITFILGEGHSLYEALDADLERQIRPYAWYVRVPDIPAFLRHIAPALERRLAGSVMAGHTGTLKINLYRTRFRLEWDGGRLKQVGEGYSYNRLEDGDALFPELTFLQLLFGYRSIDELIQSYADLYTNDNEALVLLRILFPKRPSRAIPMG